MSDIQDIAISHVTPFISLLDIMCVFCSEALNPRVALSFLDESWPYEDRILFENRGMYVVPGLGPQVYPYALIVSRRHFRSLQESHKQEREDIFECLEFLHASSLYGDNEITVFEHGGCAPTGSCVEHFHLHAIRSEVGLLESVPTYRGMAVEVTAEKVFDYRGRYNFIATYDGSEALRGWISDSTMSGHQYFRRKLARQIDDEWWDWREARNGGFMLRMVSEVRQ